MWNDLGELGDRASSGGEFLGVREGTAVKCSICSSESMKAGGSQISVLPEPLQK
jgi:hypothetical protein